MVYLCGESHAARCEQPVGCPGGEEAELGLVDEVLEVLDLLFQGGLLLVVRSVWVGGPAMQTLVNQCSSSERHRRRVLTWSRCLCWRKTSWWWSKVFG